MHDRDILTKFLNVDVDVKGSPPDVEAFLKAIQPLVVVLRHAGQEATIELAEESAPLEETVLGVIGFVSALQPEVRNIWDRLAQRCVNIGVQAGFEPHDKSFSISAETIGLMANVGFEIAFTVYAPLKD